MIPLTPLSSDWPALSTLLDEALALPGSRRDAWLASLEGERATHRDTLRVLLATQAGIETGDFLQTLPPLPERRAPGSADALVPGRVVGAYRLIEPLGAGGMGTVWLAERSDGTMKRQVALKLPRIVWGDAFAERLARERDILATLEHPHIARLYDAGIDGHGRPFLAMEYVEGQPIDVYCRERSLSVEGRLDLLVQVMAAVAHAHARLVVHRDLKPGNILVTTDGQVRLLDFGIAKLLAGDRTRATALTEYAGRALTLDYASPEQIRGEPLGTASDIYAMAVVAFEVLAGERPYRLKRGSAAELEETIANVEPPRASDVAAKRADDRARAPRLRGDLDAIVDRGLKKSPAARYATMDAFALDVRRHRAGLPVDARPDRLAYRAAKFVHRHRLQVTAGATVALALVVGASLALWQARQAERDATTARAVQGFLENVFTANTVDQVDPARARDTTARELLDRGADRIDRDLRDAPEARLRMLTMLGDLYESMGLDARHIALRRQGLDQARAIDGPVADRTVLAMAKLAHALTLAERHDEAAALLRDGAAILDARDDRTSYARFRIDVMQASLDRRIDPKHGLVVADRAVAYARREPPGPDLLLALEIQGDNAIAGGDAAKARAAYAEIVALSEAHPPLGAGELSLVYGSLGSADAALGRYAEAGQNFRKGLERERARNADPHILHNAELQLAEFYFDTGRYREALAVGRPAWEWAHAPERRSESEPSGMRTIEARILAAYGRADEALAETAELAAKSLDPTRVSAMELRVLDDRVIALVAAGRLDDAAAAIDRLDALRRQVADRFTFGPLIESTQRWRVASGRGAEALTAFEAGRVGYGLPPEPDDTSSADAHLNYATYLLAAGRPEPARVHATAALAALGRDGIIDYRRPQEARATLVLGRALLATGHPDEACPVLEHAVELHRAVFDPDHSGEVADAERARASCRHR